MEHALSFTYNARYFSLGETGKNKVAWLVCHGYGQLGTYFIRHFQPLADLGHYVVAVEGLSRFYLEGHSGRVGASWMTREDRLRDIQNYLTYLDAVAAQAGLSEVKTLNLLGFSQGVATICRWAMHTELPYQKLVLWAGVFPPDVSPELKSNRLSEVNLYQVWGKSDPFLDEEKLRQQTQYLQSLSSASFSSLSFEGKHTLDSPTLLSIATDRL